ncbi:MAG: hypothetical protein OEZ22_05035 [Spirochaetia bacterium]|nr:hypothetical protein [Spirochaetia bacterium]
MNYKYIFFVLFIFLSFFSRINAITQFNSDLNWYSIKTEHFWIHYYEGFENFAAKTAIIAEEVHKNLKLKIKWQPFLRTDIVITDNVDTANAYASAIPYNQIVLYVYKPNLDGIFHNYVDSLKLLITHEYTHILNLDSVYGLPSIFRYLFGRVYFPNYLQPLWITEGNAVYHESLDSFTEGRNNSTFVEMIFRMAVHDNKLQSLSETSNYTRKWPYMISPYIYGGSFIKYLEITYGQGSFERLLQENADNIVPYLVNYNADDIYEKSFTELWKNWQSELYKLHNNHIELIKKKPVTIPSIISYAGYSMGYPRFNHKNDAVFFFRDNPYEKSMLVKYDMNDKFESKGEEIEIINSPNSLSVFSNNSILVSDVEVYKTHSLYHEAFLFENNHKVQLTEKLRGSYIDIFPDEKNCIYIKQSESKFSLIKTDLNFSSEKFFIKETNIPIAFIKISHDSRKAVFSFKDKNGNIDLALLNFETNKITRLTNDHWDDIHPTWHPSNDKILFSSDRNGIFNLYEYDLKLNEIKKLTHLIGGAFQPDVSKNGQKIVFSSYESDGFYISLIDYPKSIETIKIKDSIILENSFFNEIDDDYIELIKDKGYEINDYSFTSSIWPTAWYPFFYTLIDEEIDKTIDVVYGFSINGIDSLKRHAYLFEISNFTKTNKLDLFFQYSLLQYYPTFFLYYFNDNLFYGKNKHLQKSKVIEPDIYDQGIGFAVSIPFSFYYSNHEINFWYNIIESIEEYNYYEIKSEKYLYQVIGLGYFYSNTKFYNYSISPEEGRNFNIEATFHNALRTNNILTTINFGYAEYLPGVFQNNVLLFKVRLNIMPLNFKDIFSLGMNFENLNYNSGLRGYPSDAKKGSNLLMGTLEYRFPLLYPEIGYSTFFLFLRDIFLTVFSDFGDVVNNKFLLKKIHYSCGIELNYLFKIFYKNPLKITVGYAKGFTSLGESQIYISINQFIYNVENWDYKIKNQSLFLK